MKHILAITLCFLIFAGCTDTKINENIEPETEYSAEYGEVKGLWLPIYEIAPVGKNEKEYKSKSEKMMKEISDFGFTDIFVQVRANCDAIYKSSVYPPCYMYADNGKLRFDALNILCKAAHESGLKIHVWINPYRVCADCERQPVNIPAGISEKDILKCDNARYLNPCHHSTEKIILSGIREIIENYNVDGIHIDDYFYPSVDENADGEEYNGYKEKGGRLSHDDFRRNTVSSLISSIYSLVKFTDETLIFSISPGADIYKDTEKMYADVRLWCSEYGYCDMIIPQLYFGFLNENMPFVKTFDEWKKITDENKVRLCVGLSIYKAGNEDRYAGESGKNEWLENDDIIKKEIDFLRENGADGFCIFSYNYVFGNRKFTKEEVKNLKSVI